MANGHSRVTVVSPNRRLDLVLPGSVPVGDLMTQLLELCTDHHDRTGALAWTLRPVGGRALAWTSSLETAQVRDGAVLELCPRSTASAQTLVEDIRDATEDAVDQRVGSWSRDDRATAAVLTLVCLAALMLAMPSLWITSSGNGATMAALAAAGALWGCVGAARRGLGTAAHALLTVGLAWTGALVLVATAAAAGNLTALTTANRAGLTAAAVLGAALAVAWVVPRLVAWSAAAAVAFAAALGWVAADLAGVSTSEAIALGTVLGILSLGILPRVALAAGGLAGLDYVVRTQGGVDPAAVEASFARSQALLTGALVAMAGMTAAGAVSLERAGSPMQLAQAIAIAGCLILRSRAFTQYLHVMVLVFAGTGCLLVQLAADLVQGAPRLSTIAFLVLIAGWAAVLARGGMVTRNDIAGARGRRLLDVAESLAVATLIPLLAGNLGVLEWIRGMVN